MNNYYAGIGSRQTPTEIQNLMTNIAKILQDKYILRSGAADGADKAFEIGISNNNKEILPWKGFNGSNSPLYTISQEALNIAKQYHPAWNRLSDPVKKLMGRNSYQVLGYDLKSPAKFVICYTTDGKASGGTGQAIRIANAYNIPVYNMFNKDCRDLEYYDHLMI